MYCKVIHIWHYIREQKNINKEFGKRPRKSRVTIVEDLEHKRRTIKDLHTHVIKETDHDDNDDGEILQNKSQTDISQVL